VSVQVFLVVIVLTLCSNNVFGYAVDASENKSVHQHITKEAEEVWQEIPTEIKNHLTKDILDPDKEVDYPYGVICSANYDADKEDDIIVGSAEEDYAASTCVVVYRNHFFNPDSPEDEITGFYSKGLLGITKSTYVG